MELNSTITSNTNWHLAHKLVWEIKAKLTTSSHDPCFFEEDRSQHQPYKMKRLGGESSKKREDVNQQAPEEVNYITSLPKAILLYILSFLPFMDWVSMSLVSREWRYLWTYAPKLNFDELRMIRMFARRYVLCPHCGQVLLHPNRSECLHHLECAARIEFMDHVDRILQHHSGCNIDNFRLSLEYDSRIKEREYRSRIDSWVHFSMTRNIEELELSFSNRRQLKHSYGEALAGRPSTSNQPKPYKFPTGSFSPKILKSLVLGFCKFRASNVEMFPFLLCLCLKQVKLNDCSIGDLLSKFPILEDLTLEDCLLPEHYLMCKQHIKVKRLALINCIDRNKLMVPIEITTPNLSTLIIVGIYLMESSLKEALHLDDVTINICQIFADSTRGSVLGSLLNDLNNCTTLRLATWCIQVLPTGTNMLHRLPTSLRRVKQLSLQVGFIKQELPGISCLLRSCPNLESLTLDVDARNEYLSVDYDMFIDMMPDIYSFEENTYWQSQEFPYHCLQTSLKNVRINGFTGEVNEMNMIMFLLNNAAVLENMVIYFVGKELLGEMDPENNEYLHSLYERFRVLLIHPKLSPQARMVIVSMPKLDD